MLNILKQENLWNIVKTKRSITSFSIFIAGRSYIEIQVIEEKHRAQ